MAANQELINQVKNQYHLRLWDEVFLSILSLVKTNQEDFHSSVKVIDEWFVSLLNDQKQNPFPCYAGMFLLACAKIANLEKITNQQVRGIFEPLQKIELLLDYSLDAEYVETLLGGCRWNSDFQRSFNSVLALDLIQQFSGSDSKPASESMPVSLIFSGKGILTQLRIEVLPGRNSGCVVYKNPRYLLFQYVKKDMEDSFTQAAKYVYNSLGVNVPVIFRWRFEDIDGGNVLELPLEGDSASAAFALCATKLLLIEHKQHMELT